MCFIEDAQRIFSPNAQIVGVDVVKPQKKKIEKDRISIIYENVTFKIFLEKLATYSVFIKSIIINYKRILKQIYFDILS